MDRPDEVDNKFQELHDASVREYEQRVQRWREDQAEQSRSSQADEKEMRDSLKSSGIDLALLDRRVKRAAEEFQARLKLKRPEKVNRASLVMMDHKQRGFEASILGEAKRAQIPAYATILMANDPVKLHDMDVSNGNLWGYPDHPGQIKLKDSSTGDGWGCWATASGPPPTATFWFTFVPDQTGQWEVSPIFTFHGFYILRADDGIFTCKMARVELEAKVDTFQYFWKGPKTYKLIDLEKDDADLFESYDRTEWLWDTVTLRAGDQVWVKVEISTNAVAAGGGSYAELNFSDGYANYIEPLLMTAQRV